MSQINFNVLLIFCLVLPPSCESANYTQQEISLNSLPFESLTLSSVLHQICSLHTVTQGNTEQKLATLIQSVANGKNISPSEIFNQLQIRLERFHRVMTEGEKTTKIPRSKIPIDKIRTISPPFGRIPLPPPEASLHVFVKNLQDPIFPPIYFSVPPFMSAMDAIHLLSRQYASESSITSAEFPLVKVKMSMEKSCYVLDRIGSHAQIDGFYWQVVVIDKNNKVLSRGPCIPELEKLSILPGSRIYLVFTNTK